MKSLKEVLNKFPEGFFSEVKYDGERIQIHKSESEIKCFSRSLKIMPDWKVNEVKKYLSSATAKAKTIILDGEVLLMDLKTHNVLTYFFKYILLTLLLNRLISIFLSAIMYFNILILATSIWNVE